MKNWVTEKHNFSRKQENLSKNSHKQPHLPKNCPFHNANQPKEVVQNSFAGDEKCMFFCLTNGNGKNYTR